MVVYYFFIAKPFIKTRIRWSFMMKVPIMIFLLMIVPAINGLGFVLPVLRD